MENKKVGKIFYIDNIKVILTMLVVLHHAAITYGAPGSWYFIQKTDKLVELFPMTVFVSVNQSFFMGFFFFLSALFVEPGYEKKGASRFILDRLKRLGIPLLFYSIVLSPVLNYTVEHYGYGRHHSFLEYMSGYHHWIDFGVMWFAAALLLFDFLYTIIKSTHLYKRNLRAGFPTDKQIWLLGMGLGLFTFLTRLAFPMGWKLDPLGFQLGDFPQYILMFIAGIIAYRNHWLDSLDYRQGKRMGRAVRIMILVILPAIFIIAIIGKIPGDQFSGGFHLISLVFSLWEMITGTLIIAAFLCIGKNKLNFSSSIWRGSAANAFGVYIFHPLILITLSLSIQSWNMDPGLKFLFVAPLAVILSFLFVSGLRRISVVKNVL